MASDMITHANAHSYAHTHKSRIRNFKSKKLLKTKLGKKQTLMGPAWN